MTRPRLLAACCAALLACASPGAPPPYEAGAAGPPGPAPGGVPPPPPGAALPDGEWVFTQQYGWLWMPYGAPYTWVPPGGRGEPVAYVFLGTSGWTWVSAPWVWGYGPRPHWHRARPDRFAWYRHGDWRTPRRWHYTGAPERGRVARSPAPPARGEARPAPAAPPPPSRVQGRGGGAGREREAAPRGPAGERAGARDGDGRPTDGRGGR